MLPVHIQPVQFKGGVSNFNPTLFIVKFSEYLMCPTSVCCDYARKKSGDLFVHRSGSVRRRRGKKKMHRIHTISEARRVMGVFAEGPDTMLHR